VRSLTLASAGGCHDGKSSFFAAMIAAMKRLALAILLATNVAAAADRNVDRCLAAHVRGQELRLDNKLRSARDSFRDCSGDTCPAGVRQQCIQWLEEVEHGLPSIVVGVRDRGGRDVKDVALELDGKRLASGDIGPAIDVDPGEHVLRALRPGHTPVEVRVVAREGERGRLVTVELETAARAESSPLPTPTEPRRVMKAPIGGYVLAGGGVVALGVAAALWLSARSDFDRLTSQCKPTCGGDQIDPARRKAIVGDVLGAVGIGMVLGGGYWVLSASGSDRTIARSLALTGGGRF
jgi:hypothetical protein